MFGTIFFETYGIRTKLFIATFDGNKLSRDTTENEKPDGVYVWCIAFDVKCCSCQRCRGTGLRALHWSPKKKTKQTKTKRNKKKKKTGSSNLLFSRCKNWSPRISISATMLGPLQVRTERTAVLLAATNAAKWGKLHAEVIAKEVSEDEESQIKRKLPRNFYS